MIEVRPSMVRRQAAAAELPADPEQVEQRVARTQMHEAERILPVHDLKPEHIAVEGDHPFEIRDADDDMIQCETGPGRHGVSSCCRS